MYGEYNDSSLGKSTWVLIDVWNRKKMDIRSKRVTTDFCVRLGGKISVKRVLYCERSTVRNVLRNEHSNIGINPSTMNAKRPVVYHALVGLAVRLQRSTSTRWLRYLMRTVTCLCDNSRRFFIFQKQPSIGFLRTSYRCDAYVRCGCRTSLPVTNFSSVWMLAMKTTDSLLRIQISYRKWSRWMKVGCITTTQSQNGRVNAGSARTSEYCGKCGSRNLQAAFFNHQEVIYQHFYTPKTKINSDYYLKVLQILRMQIARDIWDTCIL